MCGTATDRVHAAEEQELRHASPSKTGVLYRGLYDSLDGILWGQSSTGAKTSGHHTCTQHTCLVVKVKLAVLLDLVGHLNDPVRAGIALVSYGWGWPHKVGHGSQRAASMTCQPTQP